MLKDTNPLISVIVPCFNHALFLPETLESVIAQTYTHWECIVVDDGSTDNTMELAEGYARRENRIRYLYKNNGGLSSARNEGLLHSQGDYIQFLDSDDGISDRKFETQLRIFQECSEADLVYSGVKFFTSRKPNELLWVNISDPSGKLQKSGPGAEILQSLIHQNGFVVNAPLIKKSAIEKIGLFDTELNAVEDWDYWLRAAMSGVFFKYDHQESSCAFVRVYEASMSRDIPKMVAASIIVREKLEASFATAEHDKKIDKLRRLNTSILEDLRRRLRTGGIAKEGHIRLLYKKLLSMRIIRLLGDALGKIKQ